MKSLKSKIFISVMIPFVLLILVIIFYNSHISKESTIASRALGESYFKSLVTNGATRFDSWMKTRIDAVKVLSALPEEKQKDRNELLKVKDLLHFGGVYYGTANDGLMYSTKRTTEQYKSDNYDPRERPWYKVGADREEVTLKGCYL